MPARGSAGRIRARLLDRDGGEDDGIIERVPESLIGKGFKIGRLVKRPTKSKRTAWNFLDPAFDLSNPDAPIDQARSQAIIQSLRPLYQAYQARQLPILSMETLSERYGVKPENMPQAAPQGAPAYVPPAAPQGFPQGFPPYGNAQNPVALTNPAGGSTVPMPMAPQGAPTWPPPAAVPGAPAPHPPMRRPHLPRRLRPLP